MLYPMLPDQTHSLHCKLSKAIFPDWFGEVVIEVCTHSRWIRVSEKSRKSCILSHIQWLWALKSCPLCLCGTGDCACSSLVHWRWKNADNVWFVLTYSQLRNLLLCQHCRIQIAHSCHLMHACEHTHTTKIHTTIDTYIYMHMSSKVYLMCDPLHTKAVD